MREVTTKRLSGDPQVVWAAFSWRGLPSNTKNELLASIRAIKLDVPVSCYVERAALRCVMQVVVGDAMHWAPSIERQIFKCPACPQGARRLVFSGPHIPTNAATTHPEAGAICVGHSALLSRK
jgi:hypothetical protein